MPRLRFRLSGLAALLALSAAALLGPPVHAAEPAPVSTHTPAAQGRTPYEALDMSSPEATTRRFVQAWTAQDYLTVFLLLSPQAEWDGSEAIFNFMPNRLVPGFDESVQALSPLYAPNDYTADKIKAGGVPIREYEADNSLRFDSLLHAAARAGKLPFVLTADTRVEMGKVGDKHATATLHTPKTDALTLTLERLPSGRWKLDQVRWPGASENARPWDGEKGPAKGTADLSLPEPPAGQPRTPYEALDMSSPDASVKTFMQAWSSGDYLSTYYLFSPAAAWGTLTAIDSLRMEQLVRDFALLDLENSPLLGTTRSREEIARGVAPVNEFNHDASRRFDTLMVHMTPKKKLPFTILASSRAEPAKVDGDTASTTLRTPGAPDLSLTLVKLPTNRWKINQVRWQGSSETLLPWGTQPDR